MKSKEYDFLPVVALVPAFLYIGIFFIYPLFLSFYYSFTNLSLYNINLIQYVGITNYVDLFTSSLFVHSIVITIVFLILSAVIGQMFFGMLIAYAINNTEKRFGIVITLIVLMAWATPQVVAGITWYSTVSYVPLGLLNYLLHSLGISPVNFLSHTNALSVIIFANIWLGLGFSVLLFSSAIKNINPSIIKATFIDGANFFTRFFKVIVPTISNTILTDLILITLWTLGTFTMIYTLTGGGPADTTDILTIYQYRTAFSLFKIGLANAIGVIIILVGTVLSLIYLRLIHVER
ncbi:MAG: sugar ABC transporter permease [Conexivisphaerales archaeon]